MKAVLLPHYGGADDLVYSEVREPPYHPDEVLIKLKATSVNPVDWKVGAGYLDARLPGEFPLIPGWDAAGVIEAVGPEVAGFKPGDEVFGYVRRPVAKWGTYAECTTAAPGMIAVKPPALDWDSAAGLSLAGATALQSLDLVGVEEGETVLVHAAAGGVGTLAVQIAKARGARVIGTASARNHDYLAAFGAEPVEYGEGLLDRILRIAPDGPDAAVDYVGGDAPMVSVAAGTDPQRVVSIVEPGVRELGGKYLFMAITPKDLKMLAALAESGQLVVPIAAAYPLEQAAEAWRASQTGRTRGKIILRIA